MTITSAPQRSGHQAPHSQAILIVTVVAAMILAGLGSPGLGRRRLADACAARVQQP
jgi:hypothetical protein